jgi:signal transduction histidine kinase
VPAASNGKTNARVKNERLSDDATGIGLAIVSEVAQAHGWELDVTESDEGGARFEFSNAKLPD